MKTTRFVADRHGRQVEADRYIRKGAQFMGGEGIFINNACGCPLLQVGLTFSEQGRYSKARKLTNLVGWKIVGRERRVGDGMSAIVLQWQGFFNAAGGDYPYRTGKLVALNMANSAVYCARVKFILLELLRLLVLIVQFFAVHLMAQPE